MTSKPGGARAGTRGAPVLPDQPSFINGVLDVEMTRIPRRFSMPCTGSKQASAGYGRRNELRVLTPTSWLAE